MFQQNRLVGLHQFRWEQRQEHEITYEMMDPLSNDISFANNFGEITESNKQELIKQNDSEGMSSIVHF